MAARRIAWWCRRQRQAGRSEAIEHLGWTEHIGLCRGELDGQWQAVQPHADLGHCRRCLGIEREAWADCLGALDEERGGRYLEQHRRRGAIGHRGHTERQHRDDALPAQT